MGAYFKLEHANTMAYVTSSATTPPRVRREDLWDFLCVLAYEAKNYLIPEEGSGSWSDEISEAARRALTLFRDLPSTSGTDPDVVMRPSTVGRILCELRAEFSQYPLYALAIGGGKEVDRVARELAHAPMHGHLLVLIPRTGEFSRNFEVLDPMPVFSVGLHAAPSWPGFLFWTRTGGSAFAGIHEADELLHELHHGLHDSRRRGPYREFTTIGLDRVLQEWTQRHGFRSRRLLHLSDLHFGTTCAAENQPLLDAELRDVVRTVDRVVITGDLFNTPNKNFAPLFSTFKNSITHLAEGREPISIPGNHDQRMLGLFGDDYRQVARVGDAKVIVDDQCEMVFVCFNSSEEGNLARGKISSSQFRRLGGDYRTLLSARPELKGYLPVVLVHHHPFSFELPPQTWVQRVLSAIGLRDETFLEMVDAEDLHRLVPGLEHSNNSAWSQAQASIHRT